MADAANVVLSSEKWFYVDVQDLDFKVRESQLLSTTKAFG